MRNLILMPLALAAFALSGCHKPTADELAAPAMAQIDSLYEAGDYQGTIAAISRLRTEHPQAVESRKRALKLWQEASLKMTQQDIALTDSALQATIAQIPAETNLLKQNRLRARRDSLQIRYDALCGIVRVIHRRQAENK